MAEHLIRCGIIGGQEPDLPILSALHNAKRVDIVFIYDKDQTAVGIEIAEILGIPRYHTPEHLAGATDIECAVVAEPREKHNAEIALLTRTGCKILNPSEALQQLAHIDPALPVSEPDGSARQSIDDTFVALERLFDRKELLKFLLEVATQSTSSSAGSIMLYSPETRDLFIAYAVGLSDRTVKRTRQKLGHGVAGKVAQTRSPMLLGSAGDLGNYPHERDRVDIGTAISVPLLWGERLLGVLNVSVDQDARQHDEKDLETLKLLSRRISHVLNQSLKLDEVQIRHQEWRFRSTMGEIALKPISTQEKFAVLSKYLSELMGAETVEIYLNTTEGDWFVLGGSNRLLSPTDKRVRIQRGALSRAFLDNRAIVLKEGAGDGGGDALQAVASAVFCPLGTTESLGVIVFEFTEQYRLDEFLTVKDAIVHEISRFLASETRERKLTRELRALRMISDAAPAVLGCRTIKSLVDTLASTVAVILESERVSVRLAENLGADTYLESTFGVPKEILIEWRGDDKERFDTLERDKKSFSTAFLSFDPRVMEAGAERVQQRPGNAPGYRSALAFPVTSTDGFLGGIIAYDKNADDPLEDAVYSELDRKILENIVGLAEPVLDAILRRRPVAKAGETVAFESVIGENYDRLKELCDNEISRADRYHNAFTLVLFRVDPMDALFESNREQALALSEDMGQGLKTRTRKTDFGAWIKPGTYAILTLDGGRRIRFLISRAVMYLGKDLSTLEGYPAEAKRILVGTAGYPGKSKSADEMVAEAEASLKPFQPE